MSDLVQLAALVTSIIAPHLPAFTGFVAQETGKKVVGKGIDGAFNAAKSLWDTISQKFDRHPKAAKAADTLASNPDDADYRTLFASKLADLLEAEPDVATGLGTLLTPQIIQIIDADGATVRNAEQIASKIIRSRQHIAARAGAVIDGVVQRITDGRPNP